MQVTVNVTRNIGTSVLVFAGIADSIEAAIKMGNDLALGAVTELAKDVVLEAGSDEAKAELEKALPKADAKKPPAEKAASSAKSAPAETKAPDTASAKTTTAQAAAAQNAPEYSYDEVRLKILAISKDYGRDVTIAALSRFGVVAGKELKPEQYAEAYKYFSGVAAGTIDPMTSEPEAESELA